MEEVLCDVKEGKSTMNGSCNASTVSTNTKGWYWDFEVWLNTKGITNLLLVPMLEAADSLVFTYTNGNWVVTSPKRKKVIFKRGTGVYNRKPYMDLMNKQEWIAMIEVICKIFSGATNREVEKFYIMRTV